MLCWKNSSGLCDMRLIWLFAGSLAALLGIVGVITPILPTVPFLILAAFCFSKSSQRLHNWLITHPQFGPPILAWRERGAINLRAKWFSTGSMLVVWVISAMLALPIWLLALQAAALSATALFIWTRPSA